MSKFQELNPEEDAPSSTVLQDAKAAKLSKQAQQDAQTKDKQEGLVERIIETGVGMVAAAEEALGRIMHKQPGTTMTGGKTQAETKRQ